MNSDYGFQWFLVGFFVGFLAVVVLVEVWGPTVLDSYPGLEDKLSEQKAECEARVDVISCEWSEEDVSYVPKTKSNG